MKRCGEPTCTRLVFEALCVATVHGDFLDVAALRVATGCSYGAVTAALHHLRSYRAADVVVEKNGKGWWYATPGTDTRMMVMQTRKLEVNPRRRRKPRKEVS